jgi:hypothetical protein
MFSGGEASDPGMLHKPDEKKAKVFRRIYAINKEIYAIQDEEKDIPPLFRNYHLKDVTNEYMAPIDIEIEIPDKYKNKFKYAYLAVFDNRQWTPVSIPLPHRLSLVTCNS